MQFFFTNTIVCSKQAFLPFCHHFPVTFLWAPDPSWKPNSGLWWSFKVWLEGGGNKWWIQLKWFSWKYSAFPKNSPYIRNTICENWKNYIRKLLNFERAVCYRDFNTPLSLMKKSSHCFRIIWINFTQKNTFQVTWCKLICHFLEQFCFHFQPIIGKL